MYRMHTYVAQILALATLAHAILSPPQVNVYTELPLEDGKENTVICYSSEFHPPNIKVELLKKGAVMPNVEAKDMTFDETWKYKLMKYAKIVYKDGDTYSCQVTHMDGKPMVVQWEPML